MFGISMWELGLILLVALLVLGPRQLAETARVLGKLYRDLQGMVSDVRNTVDIDSVLDPKRYDQPPKYEGPKPQIPPDELLTRPGEKTGPDFYADLLEKSAEEEKKEETPSAEKEAPDTPKKAEQEKKSDENKV